MFWRSRLSALCGGYSGEGGCWGVRSVPCRGSGIEDFAGIFSCRGLFHLGCLLGFSAGIWAAAVVLAWTVPGWWLGIVPCLRSLGIGISSFPKILSFQLFGNTWTYSTSGDNNRASSYLWWIESMLKLKRVSDILRGISGLAVLFCLYKIWSELGWSLLIPSVKYVNVNRRFYNNRDLASFIKKSIRNIYSDSLFISHSFFNLCQSVFCFLNSRWS